MERNKVLFATRELTYGAICLAMAFALSFFGFEMPQGGKVTFASTLPIMIYCYYFGFRKGGILCIAFTILQFVQETYIVHFFSAVLDYVVPYLSLIFFGIFSKKRFNIGKLSQYNISFFVGAFFYIAVRYMSHVLSGVIFYGEWAWEGYTVWGYAFMYNTFFLVDAAICLVVGAALVYSKALNRFVTAPADTLQNTDTTEENNQ